MTQPRRQMGFRPSNELRERITTAADAFGVNANFLMERLLNEALDDLIEPSEFRLTRRLQQHESAEVRALQTRSCGLPRCVAPEDGEVAG